MKTLLARLSAGALLVQILFASPLYASGTFTFTGAGADLQAREKKLSGDLQKSLNQPGDRVCSAGGKCPGGQDTLPADALNFFSRKAIPRGDIAYVSAYWASHSASHQDEISRHLYCTEGSGYPKERLQAQENLFSLNYGFFIDKKRELSRYSRAKAGFIFAVANDPANDKKVFVYYCVGGRGSS